MNVALLDHTATKPRLRGWLHFGAGPLSLVLGLWLMVVTPTEGLRLAVAVYVAATVSLFAVSAAYHLGAGGPRARDLLNRLDHANIYVFVAASYTPFAAAMPANVRGPLLVLVWVMALSGLTTRVLWRSAPRWLAVGSYILLGWVAVFFLPAIWEQFGTVVVVLLGIGGVLYTAGAVVYARRSPNPHPQWFGYHEIFHACTIVAYLVQFAAVAIAVT